MTEIFVKNSFPKQLRKTTFALFPGYSKYCSLKVMSGKIPFCKFVMHICTCVSFKVLMCRLKYSSQLVITKSPLITTLRTSKAENKSLSQKPKPLTNFLEVNISVYCFPSVFVSLMITMYQLSLSIFVHEVQVQL